MSGLDKLKLRLEYLGGTSPSGRIEKGKLRSFTAALNNSYQSTQIIKLSDGESYLCLINPDSVKPDYDNKIISIVKDAGFKAGDAFYWPATNTYWLVYLTELTESAYFRGYIRRCRYKLVINDNDYYVYVQGPVEAGSTWSQRGNMIWNKGNQSLLVYVTKTPDSIEFFKRFNVIKLDGHNWRVEAVDNMSMEGVIEVNLKEFFDNQYEDLEYVPEAVMPGEGTPHIHGEYFVRPYETYTYTAVAMTGGTWTVSNNKAKILSSDSSHIIIEIVSGRSGSFDLVYNGSSVVTQTIIIESL